MKLKQTLYVYARKESWMAEIEYTTIGFESSLGTWGVLVAIREVELEIDAPTHADLVAGKVKTLQQQKHDLLAKTQMEVNQIEAQISKLLAIECST